MKQVLLHIPRALVIGLALYFISVYIFALLSKPIIQKEEIEMVDKDMGFVTYVITTHSKTVELLTDDWSYWDDAYTFVKDLNPKFISSNLSNETLRNAEINLVLFFNEKGDVVYKKTIQLQKGQVVDIPAEVYKENKVNSINKDVMAAIKSKNGISKTIQTDQGILIYSVFPILPSSGQGEPNGALFLGRYFSTYDEDLIKASTKLNFETHNFVNAPEDIQNKLIKNGKYDVFTDSEIIRYQLIKDSFDNPALYIIFKHDRVAKRAIEALIPTLAIVNAVLGILGDIFVGKIKQIFRFLNNL